MGSLMKENDKSILAREKLELLTSGLHDAAAKLNALSKHDLPHDELLALYEMNARVALYLNEIVLLLGQAGDLHLPSTLEFIDQVEYFVGEVDAIALDDCLAS